MLAVIQLRIGVIVMHDAVRDHLIQNALPAATDYAEAEAALSAAYQADSGPAAWAQAARLAKRRAAELAIALDGLADRFKTVSGLSLTKIRNDIDASCYWPGSSSLRAGAYARVRGVAQAYKHADLNDPSLPITSDSDVLVVALGYGLDGYGVGKFSGVEVLVRDKSGTVWKFLGDVPCVFSAWFKFLAANGTILSDEAFEVCGLQVHP